MHSIFYVPVLFTHLVYGENKIEIKDFLLDLFKQKHVHHLIFHFCSPDKPEIEIQRLTRFLNNKNIFTTFMKSGNLSNKIEDFVERNLLHNDLGIVLDLTCPNSYELLKNQHFGENKQINNHKFAYAYKWCLIGGKNQSLRDVEEKLSPVPLRMDSDVTLAMFNSNGISYYDVYNPGFQITGNLHVTHLGFWNPNKQNLVLPTKYKIRKDMNDLQLRIVAVVSTYFLLLNISHIINCGNYVNPGLFSALIKQKSR